VKVVVWLLIVQGLLGAFDTLWYHEWRARLPAGGASTRRELALHAPRSIIYSVIFGTLPWVAWGGAWTLVLALLLLAEIVITLLDFVVEDAVRAPLGGVFAGERVTHAIMGIVYGAMLAFLVPEMIEWWHAASGLVGMPVQVPAAARLLLGAMSLGVLASGLRDLFAAIGTRGAAWPWPVRA
jgi:hypothetical protein